MKIKNIILRSVEIYITIFMVILAGYRAQLTRLDISNTLNIMIAILASAWLVYCLIKKKTITWPSGKPAYIIYVLAVVSSTIHATNIYLAIGELYLFAIAWFIFLGVYNLVIYGWPIRHLINAAMVTGAVFVGLKILQIIKLLPSRINTCDPYVLLPNKTAAFTGLVSILALSVVLSRRGKYKTWPALLLIPSIVVTLFTASRAGLIGVAAGISAVIFIQYIRGNIAIKKTPLFFVYSAIVVIPIMVIYLARPVICTGVTSQAISPAWTSSISTRFELFTLALDLVKERPALGVGPGNFARIAAPLWDSQVIFTHAHNLYLHIAAERGLASVIALALLIIMITNDLLLMSRHTETAAAGLGAIVLVSIQGLADVPTLEPLIMRYFIIILALALAAANKGITENENTV